MRPRTRANRWAISLDEATGSEEETVMSSRDADILWRVASDLARRAAEVSRAAPSLPPLLFFTDPVRTPHPWEIAARLPAGSAVVFRHFGAPDAAETAQRLRDETARRDVRLLIGLDADLAEAAGADGVHLPQNALTLAPTLAARRPDWLLTGAWHADGEGPPPEFHALVVSPVFGAGEGSRPRQPLGVKGLTAVIESLDTPIYALGGVTAQTAPSLSGTGAAGLAGVSAIVRAFA